MKIRTDYVPKREFHFVYALDDIFEYIIYDSG